MARHQEESVGKLGRHRRGRPGERCRVHDVLTEWRRFRPGQEGFGNLRQGFLEASNVEPVNELIDLITTQRSFELNSQVVQAGDQIMQIVANLRRA